MNLQRAPPPAFLNLVSGKCHELCLHIWTNDLGEAHSAAASTIQCCAVIGAYVDHAVWQHPLERHEPGLEGCWAADSVVPVRPLPAGHDGRQRPAQDLQSQRVTTRAQRLHTSQRLASSPYARQWGAQQWLILSERVDASHNMQGQNWASQKSIQGCQMVKEHLSAWQACS